MKKIILGLYIVSLGAGLVADAPKNSIELLSANINNKLAGINEVLNMIEQTKNKFINQTDDCSSGINKMLTGFTNNFVELRNHTQDDITLAKQIVVDSPKDTIELLSGRLNNLLAIINRTYNMYARTRKMLMSNPHDCIKDVIELFNDIETTSLILRDLTQADIALTNQILKESVK